MRHKRLEIIACPNGNIRLTASECNTCSRLSSFRLPGHEDANQSHHCQRRSRIESDPVVSVSVEKHSSEGGPENSCKSPGGKERAVVCSRVARAPKIRNGCWNHRGLRPITEIDHKYQHVKRSQMSARPVQGGHGDAGHCQHSPQCIEPANDV